MWELTAATVTDYLTKTGRLPQGTAAEVAMLTGGVSNVVFWVAPQGKSPFVLKQSRAQLRTQADWFSRLDRIFRETEAQRALSRLLPKGTVPEVLFEDREHFLYAMSAVRPDHTVWKRDLLAGQIDDAIFAQAGALLGDLHAETVGQPELMFHAEDTQVFFELRIDPFYRRIADVHPIIRSACDGLVEEMQCHRVCLVHADFSPKNLLVHPEGITLVDYETVHYGDPAFDLGFFFSHLWLKAIALKDVRQLVIAGIKQAWQAYRMRLALASEIDFPSLSRRAVRHLAACLLARIDGKSLVDYLTQPADQEFVRTLTLQWLTAPPSDLTGAFEQLQRDLS